MRDQFKDSTVGMTLGADGSFIKFERKPEERGPDKKLVGAEIQGDPINVFNEEPWPVYINDRKIGAMNAVVYSPRLNKNISYVILDIEYAKIGQEITISSPNKELIARTVDIPWLKRI